MFEVLKRHKKTIYNAILITAFIGYIIFSLYYSVFYGRMGWEDEAHFWTIVKYCSVPEIFSLMQVEGHMMLWYLVVMPFAKLNIHWYPYPMMILNWLFCTGAIVLIWKKSPFHPLIKAGIMVSCVFLQLYSVHARCYSIGAFFLFCACALYTERLRKPYLYFLMLILGANTSVQGLIGATALGIPFLFELYRDWIKNKTNAIPALTVTTVTILIGVMLYFQLVGAATPDYEDLSRILNRLNTIAIFFGVIPIEHQDKMMLLKMIEVRTIALIVSLALATRGKAFFVYLFSFGLSSLFFMNIYAPRPWHIAFGLIYLIMSYWIFLQEKQVSFRKISSDIVEKILLCAIGILLIGLSVVDLPAPGYREYFYSTINKYIELRQGKVFTSIPPISISVELPKLNENNIFVYDMNNRNLSSYEAQKVIFNKAAKEFDIEKFKTYLSKDRPNYLISQENLDNNPKYENLKYHLYIEGVRSNRHYFIYEIPLQ